MDEIYETDPIEEFYAKIDWEGGDTDALEYGLTGDTYDIPTEMAQQWDEIRDVYEELEGLLAEFHETWRPTSHDW